MNSADVRGSIHYSQPLPIWSKRESGFKLPGHKFPIPTIDSPGQNLFYTVDRKADSQSPSDCKHFIKQLQTGDYNKTKKKGTDIPLEERSQRLANTATRKPIGCMFYNS